MRRVSESLLFSLQVCDLKLSCVCAVGEIVAESKKVINVCSGKIIAAVR